MPSLDIRYGSTTNQRCRRTLHWIPKNNGDIMAHFATLYKYHAVSVLLGVIYFMPWNFLKGTDAKFVQSSDSLGVAGRHVLILVSTIHLTESKSVSMGSTSPDCCRRTTTPPPATKRGRATTPRTHLPDTHPHSVFYIGTQSPRPR